MGGRVAMWFALNHPERMDKLIVVDMPPSVTSTVKQFDSGFKDTAVA